MGNLIALKLVRAAARPSSPITKPQTKRTACPETVSGSDDNFEIERSGKATLNTVTTKTGFSVHGLNAIQTTGASIANQIPAHGGKTVPRTRQTVLIAPPPVMMDDLAWLQDIPVGMYRIRPICAENSLVNGGCWILEITLEHCKCLCQADERQNRM